MNNYCILDIETTIKESFKRKANAFDLENGIVAIGKRQFDITELNYEKCGFPQDEGLGILSCTYLVGFNIKFDLLHLWTYQDLQVWLKKGGKIWDCQLAEYMLSGQTDIMPSLNKTAVKYGGTLKDERIEMLWKAGVDTTEIDEDMLTEYLENDLLNTEKVYLGQLKRLQNNPKLLKLIELSNDALLATTEMEYNGMHVDRERCEKLSDELDTDIRLLGNMIIALLEPLIKEKDIYSSLNINSNYVLSAILFGGTISTTVSKFTGKQYKTGPRIGEDKYHNEVITELFLGLTKPLPAWETKMEGVYSVDDSVLEVVEHNRRGKCSDIAKLVRQRRELMKKKNTYFDAIANLIQDKGLVHHKIHHTTTATGRLSSSDPNLQNIPREDKSNYNVKTVFTSRYKNGYVLEADYGALEVCAATYLSNDPIMRADIESGIDPHLENARIISNKPPHEITKESPERQSAKAASFQLLYGAGKKTIGDITFNGDYDKAEMFIEAYFTRYSALAKWQTMLIQQVKANRRAGTRKTALGLWAGTSELNSSTGRIYKFTEHDSPKYLQDKGVYTSFSPAAIKNYPVQGFATADIVPIMLGKLFRFAIKHRDKFLLINTVHDSVVIDCRAENLTKVIKGTKLILEDVRNELLKHFNIDFDIPLKVEVSYGPSWGIKEKSEVKE